MFFSYSGEHIFVAFHIFLLKFEEALPYKFLKNHISSKPDLSSPPYSTKILITALLD